MTDSVCYNVPVHYAHSRPPSDDRPWHELGEHLARVAKLAAEFAPSELAELAHAAGQWHDLGKYQKDFQHYIGAHRELPNESGESARKPRGVPHAAAGAALALEALGESTLTGLLVALAVEAHHGALKPVRDIQQTVARTGAELLRRSREGGLPSAVEQERPKFTGKASALAVRMLFSALVDADVLDTEAWDKGEDRPVRGESLITLRDRLNEFCVSKIERAHACARTDTERALGHMRQQVYEACASAGPTNRGTFTLTVPTGGGKTLSGLAFALHHGVFHSMRRVIVVAPYTSILEQTARVYRDVLGAENVVEHHSNLDSRQDTDRNRQACENWDAPVIVTTSVQFLESLHAAHKRPCRKLHRIANSVVLLDEVQTFPAGLLQPIYAMLKRLVEDFDVTVVHGTATQPFLASKPGSVDKKILPAGLQAERKEIIPEPSAHFEAVRHRFRLEVLGDLETPLDPAELARDAAAQQSALIITHRRDDARRLADLLGPECLHLSAAMCATHRTEILAKARGCLERGEPCLLVSTQLIEAGVDIDFPVVYRAMAGLETLAQAAGRCNREMRLPGPGRFVVYRAGTPAGDDDVRVSDPPPGTPKIGMEVGLSMFKTGQPDLSDPHLFPRYTSRVLNKCDTDKAGILVLEEELDFPEVEANFRMVDEPTISVVAPYGEAYALVE
ncbi:MAG TPA: CRISPR-associated endonuclease Cas3'', partial [Acidobacteriaceae bacterium]|nr:CRISPR-associated endonuclease Cas3'' [Acidobacteriaceae bacterium]